MKKLIKITLAFGIAAALAVTNLTGGVYTAYAATAEDQVAPAACEVARTKAWDGIKQTLGGVPESVRKIEYRGSIFYLAPNVTDDDFATVLAAGPEAVRLKPPMDNGKLYNYPVYILWNSEKTVLLVHPIIFDYDDILEPVSIPADPPASLTGTQTASVAPQKALTGQEAIDYMLSAEYADAVRTEFYKLLNEHRAANGLRELEVDLELQGYADIRAEELRTRSGHTRPDGSPAGSGWHNSWNVMNSRYAENVVGVGSLGIDPVKTATSIFTCWKESKGHNRHMLYSFDPQIKMAFGIVPKLDEKGFVTSGAVFATGY